MGKRVKIYQDHYLFVLKTTFFCFFLVLFYLAMHEKVQKFASKLPYWYKGVGAGAKCDHQRFGVRTPVHANLDLDVRGACVRCKKRTQLTPWSLHDV